MHFLFYINISNYIQIEEKKDNIIKKPKNITKKGKSKTNKSNKPNVTITEEDALRDLERRLKNEFIPYVINSTSGVKLPNNVVAALVSVAYNYGKIPSEVKSAIKQTPLSIEKINDIHMETNGNINPIDFAKGIERAHGIK